MKIKVIARHWVFVLLFCSWCLAHDPLTDKRRDSLAGRPSPGLGMLLTDLPQEHPISRSFQNMLNEIKNFGGESKIVDFDSAFTFAIHIPAGPNLTVFRYNPKRLRAVDALEEILHWEQIKEGGAYWRDYSNHPLYKTFGSKAMIMEDLAKRNLLQRPDLSPQLRDELKNDLNRVWKNRYGFDVTAGKASQCQTLLQKVSK